MPKTLNMPNIAHEDRDNIVRDLQGKFPKLDRATLQSLAAGDFSVVRRVQAEGDNPALETCLKLAHDVLEGGLKTAEAITNPILKAAAIAAAYAAYIWAQISCQDDHGR